jgi:hypothetical protein
MTHTPPTGQQLDEIAALVARATNDPFFVTDCEGQLAVWRESALTHVRRDEHGQIDMYSLPSSYRPTDEVIETIHLDSWDPGEDATDDQRRQDIYDLVDSRAAVPVLVAEVLRLRAAMVEIQRLHCDSPMGPCPVCFDGDAAAKGGDGLVPYPCPTGRLAGSQDCDPPHVRAAAAVAAVAETGQ